MISGVKWRRGIFLERLKRELQALEARNVHAILENEPLIDEVLQGLGLATNCVEDMDEWLGIFNIETRNNMLEMQSVNNKALIDELDKLLERLRTMLQNVEACEWLIGALRGLEVPNLDPSCSNMLARCLICSPFHFTILFWVKEKRAELEKLKTTFVRRASEFLKNYFASLVDFMISDKSYFSQDLQ
ncbi:Exocyst complex component SEC3A [Camellia lanceoleosa]|uniref:Exocyst complex component SEC3A n=1 Tax=Camellia lanceoleosa TaxID=1840588 RepID=A0ACC0HUS5_9ERIC|nr:Exocyst complex component SEC3A [Camellia lanceoleosa]